MHSIPLSSIWMDISFFYICSDLHSSLFQHTRHIRSSLPGARARTPAPDTHKQKTHAYRHLCQHTRCNKTRHVWLRQLPTQSRVEILRPVVWQHWTLIPLSFYWRRLCLLWGYRKGDMAGTSLNNTSSVWLSRLLHLKAEECEAAGPQDFILFLHCIKKIIKNNRKFSVNWK